MTEDYLVDSNNKGRVKKGKLLLLIVDVDYRVVPVLDLLGLFGGNLHKLILS